MSEQVNKVLYNVDQTADTTAAEKATARANIGAQGVLTPGPNIDIYNDVISTEKPRVEAGANVSVNSVLDPQTRVITYTVSATDTTYNVFNTTTDGLVPKASGTGDTGKFLKGDGTWEAISTTVNATAPLYGTGTSADPIRLLVSHGLSLVQPAGGDTALQVTHPVPAPGSTSAGKVLTCTDSLENLSWEAPASATGVQETVTPSNTYAEVTAILTAGNEPVLSVADSNGAALFRRVFYGIIAPPPNPVTAVKFARLAGSIFEMYTIDSDTGNWVYSSVPLTKHSHNAELYFHHYDDGDHYNIRNIKNYCINHVAVTNHSSDICYIEVEAPTLGTNEEYDYYVVFDCTNSSGGCNVTVQGCDAEIFHFPFYNPNGPQGVPFVDFQDKTETRVEFTGSPRYQVEVIGNRYTIHRF